MSAFCQLGFRGAYWSTYSFVILGKFAAYFFVQNRQFPDNSALSLYCKLYVKFSIMLLVRCVYYPLVWHSHRDLHSAPAHCTGVQCCAPSATGSGQYFKKASQAQSPSHGFAHPSSAWPQPYWQSARSLSPGTKALCKLAEYFAAVHRNGPFTRQHPSCAAAAPRL